MTKRPGRDALALTSVSYVGFATIIRRPLRTP